MAKRSSGKRSPKSAPRQPEVRTPQAPEGGSELRPSDEAGVPPAPQGEAEHTHCGFIAVIGAPNVGKSTLVNALTGSKVAIVSHKVQTTRALVRGIAMEGGAQLIFVDTPGIFAPKRRLDRAMVNTAWSGAHDADIVCLLVDAKRGIDEEADAILTQLADVRRPRVLVLNKVDLVDKPRLLTLAQSLNQRVPFEATFMTAAISGDGVRDLKQWLAAHAPEGPWHYPEDEVSDAPMRQLAAEITREKLYERLHQELPYQSTVETESWKDLRDGAVRIEQTIYVERESQKKIVLGKGGATIKAIGADARREIAVAIEQPVHLFLFVKVREGWGDDPERYREMGLEFPKD
jgi:GTP-binding protein Era